MQSTPGNTSKTPHHQVPDDKSDGGVSREDSEEEGLYIARAQLQRLVIAKETLERHGHMNEACGKVFYKCEHELRLEKQRSMAQTTIEDNFTKK